LLLGRHDLVEQALTRAAIGRRQQLSLEACDATLADPQLLRFLLAAERSVHQQL
jgi:hypothetical protein